MNPKISRLSLAFSLLVLLACSPKLNKQNAKLDVPAYPFEQDLRESYELARQWFGNSMRDKGLFRYTFQPGPKNVYGRKNNAIRQLMASRLLAEMCHEDTSLIELHQRNLKFLFRYWYKETASRAEAKPDIDSLKVEPDGSEIFLASNLDKLDQDQAIKNEAYIFYNKKSKLGANAMMLRTLAVSPLYDQYKDRARKIYNGIKATIAEDGSMDAFYIEPKYYYRNDYLLTFYSGEAIVALMEYGIKTQDKEVLDLAILAQDHYIEKYVHQLEENYYPAYVPWHTISLNLLYKHTQDQKYADAIFVLNDKVLELQDTTEFVGRFFNPETPQYGSPHTSSDGVYTEGLAYAYEIALLTKDNQRADKYLKAIGLSIPNLRSVQFTPEECKNFRLPHRAIGGFRSNATGTWIRIDCGQHIMDAYRKLFRLKGEPGIF